MDPEPDQPGPHPETGKTAGKSKWKRSERRSGDGRYQEVAYIWFAPRKLHLQSYASLKNAFGETRKLRPVMFDEIDQSEGIQPGEILFVNWESVNKESNVMVRENESFASLYEIARRTQEEYDLPIKSEAKRS